MNQLSTPLVALAVLGLVAFVVFTVLRRFRQRAQERRAALRFLAFEPVPAPDREVIDTIVALCRRGKEGHYRVDGLLEVSSR